MYQERIYRTYCNSELNAERIVVDETDLLINYNNSINGLENCLIDIRKTIKDQIDNENHFLTSLEPIDSASNEPRIIQHMKSASNQYGVGPMAAVAGAISDYIAKDYIKDNTDLIIENGGDIFIKTSKERHILIHAGDSQLSDQISIKITPEMTPIGVCTSSGKLGHSLSFGKADAVVVVAKDILYADAAATAICNIIKTPRDIERGLGIAKESKKIEGIVIILDDSIGIWGNIVLI